MITRRSILSLIPLSIAGFLLPRFLSRWFPDLVPVRSLGPIVFSQPSFSEDAKLIVQLCDKALPPGVYTICYRLTSGAERTQQVEVRTITLPGEGEEKCSCFHLRGIPVGFDHILKLDLYRA